MSELRERAQPSPRLTLRRRVFEIVESGRDNDHLSSLFDWFLIILIISNVLAFAAETVPGLHHVYHFEFVLFEIFSVAVFTFEYVIRLWTGVEMPFLNRLSPLQARVSLAARPFMVLDLIVILPFYLSIFFPLVDLRVLRLFRVLRILKLARYSPALHALMMVMANERRSLLGALILTVTMLLFGATGIYFLEKDVPGSPFTSVPAAGWWAVATLTTVGYGDMVPVTPQGKLFGALIMLIGLGLFALPIAILSTGFAHESARRDFVISWSLLSRIPLFAKLDAKAIAELVNVLQSHTYPANREVVRAGSPGISMFFIASGEVLIERPDVTVTLRAGDFFGEVAMIDRENYAHTVSSLTNLRLLELHYADYGRLCRLQPDICDHIQAVAAARRLARKSTTEAVTEVTAS